MNDRSRCGLGLVHSRTRELNQAAHPMDIIFLAIMLGFFGLTWGFVRLCEKV